MKPTKTAARAKPKAAPQPMPMDDGASKGALVTPTARRHSTVKEDRNAARVEILDHVEQHKADVVKFLSMFDISFDVFQAGLHVLLMSKMEREPDFFDQVSTESVMEALFRCAKDGLIPDGKEAAIGHFLAKGAKLATATYMPMRDGFVKVLWRTGMVLDINDNVVTENEEDEGRFEYEEGTNGFIRHRPSMKRTDKDVALAAYCVINLVGGGTIREVVTQDELRKIAKMSKSSARAEWKFQMDRKAALRRIMGKMPKNKWVEQLLAHDDLNYDLKAVAGGAQAASGLAKSALFGNRVAVRGKPGAQAPALEDRRERDQPMPMGFKPRAIISSSTGERDFDDPAEWAYDIRTKLNGLQGDSLAAFWRKNLPFVLEAGENGIEAADGLLDMARSMGLPEVHS